MFDKIRKAYRVSVPLVAVNTADPGLFTAVLTGALPAKTTTISGKSCDSCVVTWDVCSGLSAPAQENGSAAAVAMRAIASACGMDAKDMIHPHVVLRHAVAMPAGAVLVMHNLSRYLGVGEVVQALWNLRDEFKIDRRMVVMVGVHHDIPAQLRHDVLELSELLPDVDSLEEHIRMVLDGATHDYRPTAEACQGYTLFGAEQVVLMNAAANREVDVAGVWADKCAKINQVPGLKVATGRPYSTVAGLSQLKLFVSKIMQGDRRPNLIVWVDEFEKALGGAKTDTSGVSQDQVAQLLHWMETHKASGCILAGPPGTAKSAFAQATGAEFNVPTIRLDLGGMKGSLIGESENRIREALAVLAAVSGGRTLWLATVNSLDRIPPELRRRFRFGTWYLGLPNREEREAIWALYCQRFGLDTSDAVDLFGQEWTGAEIETCCDLASQSGMTIAEAAEFIAPVSRDPKGAADIAALKVAATGSFLDASRPGVYQGLDPVSPASRKTGRRSIGM